jgi:hypothetical protein
MHDNLFVLLIVKIKLIKYLSLVHLLLYRVINSLQIVKKPAGFNYTRYNKLAFDQIKPPPFSDTFIDCWMYSDTVFP